MQKISNLFDLLVKKGANKQYGGENVTQLEHAIQCAELAEKNNKSEKFITACLFHDIGHLFDDDLESMENNEDGYHENVGSKYLKDTFSHEVVEIIKGHVDAKRYLTFIDQEYFQTLSKASQISLKIQGGAFDKQHADEFISKPFMQASVELRKLDDLAKIEGKKIPNIEYFRKYVEKSLI